MASRPTVFFRIAGYLLLIFAAIHTIGHFSDPASRLQDDESKRVWHLVLTHDFNVDGSILNLGRIQSGFDWFLIILLVSSATQILLIARTREPQLIRTFAILYLIIIGALLVVTTYYIRILPPVILFALIWIMLLMSLARWGKTTKSL